mgnify:CR=1 FL=1
MSEAPSLGITSLQALPGLGRSVRPTLPGFCRRTHRVSPLPGLVADHHVVGNGRLSGEFYSNDVIRLGIFQYLDDFA